MNLAETMNQIKQQKIIFRNGSVIMSISNSDGTKTEVFRGQSIDLTDWRHTDEPSESYEEQ